MLYARVNACKGGRVVGWCQTGTNVRYYYARTSVTPRPRPCPSGRRRALAALACRRRCMGMDGASLCRLQRRGICILQRGRPLSIDAPQRVQAAVEKGRNYHVGNPWAGSKKRERGSSRGIRSRAKLCQGNYLPGRRLWLSAGLRPTPPKQRGLGGLARSRPVCRRPMPG
jgi:hypothetical protein